MPVPQAVPGDEQQLLLGHALEEAQHNFVGAITNCCTAAMWLWGHEHSLALFKAGLLELQKGRLIGCSTFELPAGDGYAPRFKEMGYDEPVVKLGMQNEWLNHGCAVIDMGDKVVDYYQFPSGGAPFPPMLT